MSPFEDRSASDECPADALGHAGGLLVALDLDRPALGDLEPAIADVIDRQHLDAGPNAGAGRHRRREADLVPAIVDAELESGRLEQPAAEAVDRRERQVPMRDGGAEGTLLLGPLDVDVDPLVVAREVGEGIDHLLRDLAPVARTD